MPAFRSTAAASLLLVLALPAAAAEVVVGSGRFEEAPAGAAVWKPKACALPATVVEVKAQAGSIKAGAVVATLSVEGLADAVAEARRGLGLAEREQRFAKADAEAMEKEMDAAAARAQAESDAATEKRKHWAETERADALLDFKQKIEAQEAGVKDAREELRQLEQMYKEARIDSSTQDLVVGRERRKLRQAEAELEQARRRFTHYEAVELPQADAAMDRAETEADLRVEAQERHAARERAKSQDALAAAAKAVDAARTRLADLEADAAAPAVVASVDGHLGDVALKAGDKVAPGQEIAKVAADAGGQVRFEAGPETILRLPVGAHVHLRWPETGASAAGTVVESAWAGRAEGAATRFGVVVKTAASSRPGLKVEVAVDDGRKK